MPKYILFISCFIGFILIIIYFTRIYTLDQCPRDKIVYRFIPKSLNEQVTIPIPIDDIYKDMFQQPSPWVGSFNIHEKGRKLDGFGVNPDGGFTTHITQG